MKYSNPFRPFLLLLIILLESCGKNLYNKEALGPAVPKDFKVIGCLSTKNLDKIDSIRLNYLTHLNLAFANPDSQGNLNFNNEQNLARVVDRAHKVHVKVYLSIAGGGIDYELAQDSKNDLSLLSAIHQTLIAKIDLEYFLKHCES